MPLNSGGFDFNVGRGLALGIADAGRSLGQGLQWMGERKKREEEEEKNRAREFKSLAEYADVAGYATKDQTTPMDLDTLKGLVRGKEMQAMSAEAQRSQQNDMEAAAAIANMVRGAQPGQMRGGPAPGLFGPLQVPREPITPQLWAQYAAQSPGAMQSKLSAPFLEQLARGGGESGGGQNVMPVPARVGNRDLIVNPKSGAFQDVTAQPAPQIPPGLEAIGAVEDEQGRLTVRYGFPKAEGKALTQTEVGGIAALNQAEMDLNVLEKIYNDLGKDYGGPISGRVKSTIAAGQNANIASLENAITAATPNLARGVFREVGVLTDQDIERYKKLLPSPYDTQEVRKRKIDQLRDRIAKGKKEMVASLKNAGRDVSGFDDSASTNAPTRFDSEAEARAANVGTNVFELYDPATATYRKARLK